MERFVGTKIVKAEKAYRLTGPGVDEVILASECVDPAEISPGEAAEVEGVTAEEGYKVVYEGGYESWSPKETFEKAYRRTDGMNFGLALEAAKMGKKIARAGWNGKGMYVVLTHGLDFHTDADLSELADQDVEVLDCLVMRTATGSFCPGWLASQSDMLADDWYIVE